MIVSRSVPLLAAVGILWLGENTRIAGDAAIGIVSALGIAGGVNVLQSDLESGLAGFDDASFDCVILSQTLQAMRHAEDVVAEMLRVGREAIVSFPNFAYWKMRVYLVLHGRMPKTEFLPYDWYNTPNIHFCSIEDFDAYCDRFGLRVERRIYLSSDRGGRVLRGVRPNLFAESAVYLLAKR